MKVWLKAFRLRTLPLALSSILMGGFLAFSNDSFRWDIFLLCITTTILLQILSNLANDYGDSVNGADSHNRVGPKRTVQTGEISSSQMKAAVIVFVILSLVSGILLLFIAFGPDPKAIGFFLILGLLSIMAAIAYTVGKKPYGYAGLGDLSVFVFFGLVGVMGSYYLFTKQLHWSIVLPAISCGAFSIAVLNINNIRDIDSDLLAGKYSIPVRIGRTNAIYYHIVLLVAGFAAAVLYVVTQYHSPWQLLFILVTPLLVKNALAISTKPSRDLDPYLRHMAFSTLLFVLLFGIGLILS